MSKFMKFVEGYRFDFQVQAPKPANGGKGGPRILNHVVSVPAHNYEKVLELFKSGVTPVEGGSTYTFAENLLLCDNPKFKADKPVWAGVATIEGKTYDCFVFKGIATVFPMED